ncbi:MAG: NusG domain II-containing protein [Oscillospiraceae bacterium]|jgi:hypothetical protein|nr:NusG domain II-containing protein [Oscillospiraceae bacterium]
MSARRLWGRWDIFVVLAVLVLAGALFLPRLFHPSEVRTVTVSIDGQVWQTLRVTPQTAPYTLALPTSPAVTLAGAGTEIWFAHADCPNQLCVQSGKIGGWMPAAACLPARVLVTVSGAERGLDALTY